MKKHEHTNVCFISNLSDRYPVCIYIDVEIDFHLIRYGIDIYTICHTSNKAGSIKSHFELYAYCIT